MATQIILEYMFAGAQGGAIGSFIGVVVSRIPPLVRPAGNGRIGTLGLLRNISWPGSHCEECNSAVHLWDMIPAVSYLLLRGRCRCCGAAIGLENLILELIGFAIGLMSISIFGWSSYAVMCFFGLAMVLAVFAFGTAVRHRGN